MSAFSLRRLAIFGRSAAAFTRLHPHPRNLAIFALATIVSLVFLNNLPIPFAWIALLWFGLLLAMTITGARPLPRYLWFNLGFVCLVLGIVELYLAACAPPADRVQHHIEGELFTDHAVLGYAPHKNAAARWQLLFDERVINEVTVRTDRHGLRLSPQGNSNAVKAVVCFGGSFTFGQGVEDEETWPYRIGKCEDGTFRVYNFGFAGYGAHQMLAALEHGVVDQVLEHAPHYGVYLAIQDHPRRVAGKAEWDEHGPRYALTDDGRVAFQGHFDDDRWFPAKWHRKLRRSYLFDRLQGDSATSVRPPEMELYLGVVETARTVFERKYPGSQFHILLWDAGDWPHKRDLVGRLQDRNLRVHLISEIMPDLENHQAHYVLEHDGHPNPLAHERIAEYVAETIVR